MRHLGNCLGKTAGWDPVFSESRRGKCFDVHKTWINWLEEARRTGDEDEEPLTDSSEEGSENPSIIQEFMRGLQGSFISDPEAVVVESFCDSARLEALLTGTFRNLHSSCNIWFAGSCVEATGSPTIQPQWLTAETFFREFGKHVSPADVTRKEGWMLTASCSALKPKIGLRLAGRSRGVA